MKIEKPDWRTLFNNAKRSVIEDLEHWWANEIEPVNQMLEQGEWHYSYMDGDCLSWSKERDHDSTHKALLINIQEIKPKTKEEIYRDLLIEIKNHFIEFDVWRTMVPVIEEALSKEGKE